MIVITGATGALGSRIVDRLLEQRPATDLGVSVRDPAKVAHLADRGVRVRPGDYTDGDGLRDSFEGAEQVLIVSASVVGDEGLRQHRTAITAAREAGAQRILYTSHQAASPSSRFAPGVDHAAAERELEASGVAWTSLRNGFYANTVPMLAGDAATSGRLVAPADGPVSWTTRDDLAAAAAAILLQPGRFEGPTPPLTAAAAVDLDGVAQLLTDVGGRPVERVVADDEDWVAGLVAHGQPEPMARMLLGMFHAARAGEFDVVDPTLQQLIGREPAGVRDELTT